LVNELAMYCHGLGLEIWSVIDVAVTKPFGFVTISPTMSTITCLTMSVSRVVAHLNQQRKSVNGSRILLVGLA
jgi:UDP-N-acetyl-D-mannosaminuronic acid dehydrogenase/UDP-N-acetyl-D-glucosamine dehydrogenase